MGCCKFGEHVVDTQGFFPCKTTPSRLYFWEEVEVKKQTDALIILGKMKLSSFEYACRITLLVKNDGSGRFCGDYRPINLQIRKNVFPMPLVEDVLT